MGEGTAVGTVHFAFTRGFHPTERLESTSTALWYPRGALGAHQPLPGVRVAGQAQRGW